VPELKSETDTSYFDDFEEAVAIRTKGKPKVQRSLRAHVIHVIHARSHARTRTRRQHMHTPRRMYALAAVAAGEDLGGGSPICRVRPCMPWGTTPHGSNAVISVVSGHCAGADTAIGVGGVSVSVSVSRKGTAYSGSERIDISLATTAKTEACFENAGAMPSWDRSSVGTTMPSWDRYTYKRFEIVHQQLKDKDGGPDCSVGTVYGTPDTSFRSEP